MSSGKVSRRDAKAQRAKRVDALYLFGFAIQAKGRELVENRDKLKLPCTYVAVTQKGMAQAAHGSAG